MATNENKLPVFKNIAGTVCSSYKIGPKGIALASRAETSNSTSDLTSYQSRLIVVDAKGSEHKVVYDTEIPLKNVKSMSTTYDSSGKQTGVKIVIINDDNTEETINLAANISATVEESELESGDKLVLVDSTGKLKNAGIGIVTSDTIPTLPENYTSSDVIEYLTKLAAVEAAASDTEVPTFKAITSYVGSVTNILNKRLSGDLAYTDNN